MKNILMLVAVLALISSTTIASNCDEYGRKLVACYELGNLSSSYDEEGIDCGEGEENVWEVKPSENASIVISTISYREYGYMGGHAWESRCSVIFTNTSNETCRFDALVSLGTEDGDIYIRDFKCTDAKKNKVE